MLPRVLSLRCHLSRGLGYLWLSIALGFPWRSFEGSAHLSAQNQSPWSWEGRFIIRDMGRDTNSLHSW
jgi:hypothetical protein